jgi:hypothetical protein
MIMMMIILGSGDDDDDDEKNLFGEASSKNDGRNKSAWKTDPLETCLASISGFSQDI